MAWFYKGESHFTKKPQDYEITKFKDEFEKIAIELSKMMQRYEELTSSNITLDGFLCINGFELIKDLEKQIDIIFKHKFYVGEDVVADIK